MANPLISVIIPVYNCEDTIAVAIDSIVKQTYENLEIIVVNDASTDKTKSIVAAMAHQDSRIKLVEVEDDPNRFDAKLGRNINAGYSARNKGLGHAHGELITFQDADDASLLNRIEVQYDLLTKYKATHVAVDWVQFTERYLNKKLDASSFLQNPKMLGPKEIYSRSQRSKGLVAKISPVLNRAIPFHLKRKRIINKLFFGSLENYPIQGNCPLFRREVIQKVTLRKLADRIWPSFMGRGADKDFNFQIAETFQNSYAFFIPLYMWRVKDQNPAYAHGIDRFIA